MSRARTRTASASSSPTGSCPSASRSRRTPRSPRPRPRTTVAASALRKYGGAAGETALAIKSPIAGTVIDRDVVMGQLADPSKTLFRVGDLSTLWLIAHVFERDAVRVQAERNGALATFAALPGKTVDARDQVDRPARSTRHRARSRSGSRFRTPTACLRPGMSATVSIPLGDAGDGQWSRSRRGGAAGRRELGGVHPARRGRVRGRATIGRGRDLGGEVEVLSGLQPGEEVVVDGAFLLKAEADKARGGGRARPLGGDHDRALHHRQLQASRSSRSCSRSPAPRSAPCGCASCRATCSRISRRRCSTSSSRTRRWAPTSSRCASRSRSRPRSSGLPNVRRVRSTSTLGVVQITIEFEPDADYCAVAPVRRGAAAPGRAARRAPSRRCSRASPGG